MGSSRVITAQKFVGVNFDIPFIPPMKFCVESYTEKARLYLDIPQNIDGIMITH